MKTRIILLLSLVMIATACSNDSDSATPDPVTDPLDATGLLGTWEFQGRMVDGQDTGAEPCCIFLEMTVNVNPNDLQGSYLIYGAIPQEEGIFIVNTTEETVEFSEGGQDNVYSYSATSTMLTLSRTKETKLEVETYIKRN